MFIVFAKIDPFFGNNVDAIAATLASIHSTRCFQPQTMLQDSDKNTNLHIRKVLPIGPCFLQIRHRYQVNYGVNYDQGCGTALDLGKRFEVKGIDQLDGSLPTMFPGYGGCSKGLRMNSGDHPVINQICHDQMDSLLQGGYTTQSPWPQRLIWIVLTLDVRSSYESH